MRTKARRISKADETPEFQEFWSVWHPIKHRNDGRHSARDEFFRHVEEYGSDPLDIVDGARWFRLTGGNSGDFKVHAQTWLNRGDYEDGCEQWRNHQAKQEELRQKAAQPRQAGNVVEMTPAPSKPSEAERAAAVERARAQLRRNA